MKQAQSKDIYDLPRVIPATPISLANCPYFVSVESAPNFGMISLLQLCDRLGDGLYVEYSKCLGNVGPQLSLHVLYIFAACEASGKGTDTKGDARPRDLLQVPDDYWKSYPLKVIEGDIPVAIRTRADFHWRAAPYGLWNEIRRSIWAYQGAENRVLQIDLHALTCRALLAEEQAVRRMNGYRADSRGMKDALYWLKPSLSAVATTDSFLSVYGIVPWY